MADDLEARKSRQAKVSGELRSRGTAALLTTHPADIRYLCGFTGSSAVLMLVHDDGAVLFTD